jgi:hypothetical protein
MIGKPFTLEALAAKLRTVLDVPESDPPSGSGPTSQPGG